LTIYLILFDFKTIDTATIPPTHRNDVMKKTLSSHRTGLSPACYAATNTLPKLANHGWPVQQTV